MIKISNFNFNEKGEIINIKSKSIDKKISFNKKEFKNLKDLFSYLSQNILNGDIVDKKVSIKLQHKKNNRKEEFEILKVEKENNNDIKISTFNNAMLDYQPFIEIKDTDVLIDNNLSYNTKLFINNSIKIKK